MASLEEAARVVKSSFGTKQDKIEWQIATLGDGKGNVDAGNGYVFVRLKENSSKVEILNDGVSLTDGMLVRIEKPAHDRLHWHVVSKNDQRIDESSNDPSGYNVGPHHRTHEYLGVDQVNSDFRQITNLRVYAVSGTFTVGILLGLIPRSGANKKVPSQTLDLTAHVPATGARYCLISVDSTGTLIVTDGTVMDGILSLSAETDIPATPSGNWRLAAVRLYAGQTAISESTTSNDMIDLRFPEERIAGSTTDAFGVQTANTYFAGPSSGAAALPTFRAGVTDDIASGVFPIARGGTNGSTATQAITNLLPSQAGQAGNVLGTNGTVASWVVPGGGGGGGTITVTSLPVGTIAEIGGSSIPSGWLECNGAAVSRATYSDLFAAIGVTFGSGDGSTTFNLPDKRGRTSIGQGTGSGLTPRTIGATGGEETHVLITAEMPAHTHSIDLYDASSGSPVTTKTGNAAGNVATIQSGSTGSGGAHNTMPPFLVTAFIIKYTDTATSALIYDDAGATISQVTLTASGTGVRIYAARDDHHHQLDQSIAPTWTGAHTFTAHDVISQSDDTSGSFRHIQYSATKSPTFSSERAQGSLAIPAHVNSGDALGRFTGRGYGATGWAANHTGSVAIVALEDFTDSAQGTGLDFYTTPIGSVTRAANAHINGVGQFQGPSIALANTSNQLVLQSAGVTGTLTWTPTSTNKTITFPDGTGTAVLSSYINTGNIISSGIISDTSNIVDDFQRADTSGTLGTAPTGQTWQTYNPFSATWGITSGRMVLTAGAAIYPYILTSATRLRAGGKFSFVVGGGSDPTPVAIIATADSSLLNNMVHFIVTPAQWTLQVRQSGGSFDVLISGTHTLATDGTVYEAYLSVVGNTAVVQLPDGSFHAAYDSRISSLFGYGIIWELTMTATSVLPRWESIIAEPIVPSAQSFMAGIGQGSWIGGRGSDAIFPHYALWSTSATETPSTVVDIDGAASTAAGSALPAYTKLWIRGKYPTGTIHGGLQISWNENRDYGAILQCKIDGSFKTHAMLGARVATVETIGVDYVGDTNTLTLAAVSGSIIPSAAGAYTITFPATGTTALGAGTLTNTSTNDVTGSAHTHAITNTSNATAASILSSDASGGLQLKYLGVGTAYDATQYPINTSATYTDITSGIKYGALFSANDIRTGNGGTFATSVIGFGAAVNYANTYTANDVLYGFQGRVSNANTGALYFATGLNAQIILSAAGGITFSRGVDISATAATGGTINDFDGVNLNTGGAGAITTARAIHIQSTFAAGTAWAIYSEATAANSWHAGKFGIGGATRTPASQLDTTLLDATTNAVNTVVTIGHNSSGTPAAGFGQRIQYTLQTSTTANTNAAAWDVSHVVATHASRTEHIIGYVNDSGGEREWIRGYANGSISQVGICLGADPSARLHLPAGGTAAGSAPLKLTTQASPLTVVEQGTFELVGNSLQFSQLARRRGVVMSQNTRTADFTLAASSGTSESAAVVTSTHGAGYLEVGKSEEIVLVGTMSQRSNPNANLTIRVKYAGSTALTFATSINTAIAANSAILIRIYCTCRTTGATGTLQINAVVELNGTATDPQAATLVTIDTTTAQDTTATFQWGSDTDAANTITIHQARVLCVEPSK